MRISNFSGHNKFLAFQALLFCFVTFTACESNDGEEIIKFDKECYDICILGYIDPTLSDVKNCDGTCSFVIQQNDLIDKGIPINYWKDSYAVIFLQYIENFMILMNKQVTFQAIINFLPFGPLKFT